MVPFRTHREPFLMMEVHPTHQAVPSRAAAATQFYGVESQPAIGESAAVSFLRSALLVLCAVVLCVLTVWEGVRVGADRTMPGALARHKNAFAVAISCLAHGHC